MSVNRVLPRIGDEQVLPEADSVLEVMDSIDQDHRGLLARLACLEQARCSDLQGVCAHLNGLHDHLTTHFATEERLIAQVCGEAWLLPHQVEHNHLLRVVDDGCLYAASARAEAGALGGLLGVVTRWLRQELTMGDPVVFMAVRELRGRRVGARAGTWVPGLPGALLGRG